MRQNLQNGIKNVSAYRLDKIICNNKQKWNKDKCRCDCKRSKAYATKDIPGIQVLVNANAIKHVILVNIQIIQIVSAEKNQLIN